MQPNIKLVEANQKLIDDGLEIISYDKCDLCDPLVQTTVPYP